MSSLTEIAARHVTDKGTDHRYLDHYERHLGHLRDEEFVLLELGIGGYEDVDEGGGSLRMWADYFPRAQVIGLDIAEKSVQGDRITVFQGSQDDAAVLERIITRHGAPRVIIDDGSHFPHHVRASFATLFPRLVDGGVYIIEDVQTSYWPEFWGRRSRHAPGTTMSMVKSLVDGLNFEEIIARRPSYTDERVTGVHCYHNLVVIDKGDNREGSNKERVNPERFGPMAGSRAVRIGRARRFARQTLAVVRAARGHLRS